MESLYYRNFKMLLELDLILLKELFKLYFTYNFIPKMK